MKNQFLTTLALLVFVQLKSQITLLPSAGIQTSQTKMLGTSPIVNESFQNVAGGSGSLQLLINTRKSMGILLGFSKMGVPLKVKYYTQGQNGAIEGAHIAGNDANRFELGYFMNLKPLFLNNILEYTTPNTIGKGLNIAPQLFFAIGYLKTSIFGNGSSGGGSTKLTSTNFSNTNGSVILGSNFLFKFNNKKVVFLSISKNWNIPYAVSKGVFSVTTNNQTENIKVVNNGSGWNFSLGFPIKLYQSK